MRILFLTHSFNSLAQRLFVELTDRGHNVSVEFDINDAVSEQAVQLFQPDLILAPFLKRAIPESIWQRHTCLIVHPGPPGDRGSSSLDWAIMDAAEAWGVTVLQAEAEMDAGPIWASSMFAMREASKSSLYRNEVTQAAVDAVLAAVSAAERNEAQPQPASPEAGKWRPAMKAADRAIDWSQDNTAAVIRKIRAGDGSPGVRVKLLDRELYLFDARPAPGFGGTPGQVVARSGPAIAVATTDGALWIGHVKYTASAHPFKLPASRVLAAPTARLPEIAIDEPGGYREIHYEEGGDVGVLHFSFYNGAMGTQQCERLLAHYKAALTRDTKVLVLAGGPEFWSNGMNLNLIEAADSAADESWRNINAIDDLAEAILNTKSHLTVAALQGNAGAGGVFLARACDKVWMRSGVVLNPHYKDMGNLYGSEFWTYSLPKYAGAENARTITQTRLPMGSRQAQELGLADACVPGERAAFLGEVKARAASLARSSQFMDTMQTKQLERACDESEKPLAEYRAEELQRMKLNFYGFDPSYHIARYNFVAKVPKSRTPVTIARHRASKPTKDWRNAS
jgi:putative two-component system protein, hydrogenase maturation factor HypX/HoxX